MDEYRNKSDEELVEIVRKKDIELYALVIERFQSRLLRYANYLLNDQDKAKNAVQECFIKAYINLNSFDITKKFSSWIYRIAHNEVMNIVSKNKRFVSFDSYAYVDSNHNDNIEEYVQKADMVKQTHKCLSKLELKYREPLALYYLDEKTYEEISDVLRLPLGTVAIRIKRAKVLMKNICQTKLN